MKLFALFLLLPAMARCVTVETLPQSEFADKEVFDCGRWFRRSAADDYETVETDNQGQPGFAVEVR